MAISLASWEPCGVQLTVAEKDIIGPLFAKFIATFLSHDTEAESDWLEAAGFSRADRKRIVAESYEAIDLRQNSPAGIEAHSNAHGPIWHARPSGNIGRHGGGRVGGMIAWDTMQVSASKSAERFGGAVAGIGGLRLDRPDDPLSRSMAVKDSRRAACIGGEGVIVTADHALDPRWGSGVELPDGGAVRGLPWSGAIPRTDLAVLRIPSASRAADRAVRRRRIAAGSGIWCWPLAVTANAGLSTELGRHQRLWPPAVWASAVGGKRSIYLDLTIYPGFLGRTSDRRWRPHPGHQYLGRAERREALSIANAVVEDVVGDLLHEGTRLGATKSMSCKNGDRSCGTDMLLETARTGGALEARSAIKCDRN